MQDLISIIIPVYNSEGTLHRCLESVVNQTYSNLEIIIIESASEDGSPMICDEYARSDSRIKVIHQKERKGLSNARNEGLKLVTGDYVGYVDSDDWISLDMYKELLDILKKTEADIAGGEVVRVFEGKGFEKKSKKKYEVSVYSQNEFAELYFKVKPNRGIGVFTVWNKLYKADIAKAMKFPEGHIAEDVEGFYWAMSKAHQISMINQPVYYYWYRASSLSNDWFSDRAMDGLRAWRNVYKYTLEENRREWQSYARISYYRSYFGMLCRLILSGESNKYKKEKDYLLKHLRKHYIALMFSHMTMGRKAVMTSMVLNYPMTEKGYRFLYNRGIISDRIGVV